MATPRSLAAAKRAKAQGPQLPENHTASEARAHEIRTASIDLTPSVDRIMNSGLHEAGRLHAITLFGDSLGVPGDPNRYPVNAIEAGRLVPDDTRSSK